MFTTRSSRLPSFDLDEDADGEQVLTSLSNFVGHLGRLGVSGPYHLKNPSLAGFGSLIGQGAQFEVFTDRYEIQEDVVFKRVRVDRLYKTSATRDVEARSHLRTIELEIKSLCDPLRSENRNIVKLKCWGYDYPTSDLSLRVPVLMVERALCSLETALSADKICELGLTGTEIPHYFSLDIAAGLRSVHESNLVHGDLKPANVLIFRQDNPGVPFIAKLSDFGSCIALDTGCLTYTSYRGTEEWQPPEIESSSTGTPRNLESQQLIKCDAYVYGLVVAYLFLSCASSSKGARLARTRSRPLSLVADLIELNLPPILLERLRMVVGNLTSATPEIRPDIAPDLFLCDVESSQTWLDSRREHAVKPQGTPGFKTLERHGTQAYYTYNRLEASNLRQLEAQYRAADELGRARFNNEVLFRMAIGLVSSAEPGHRERVVEYAVASARLSFVPAQAIIRRWLDAVPQASVQVSPDEVEDWLFNGASQGSLIAIEDLKKIDPEKARLARLQFVANGGYCKTLSSVRYESALTRIAGLADSVLWLDDDGNSLLHYAAAFANDPLVEYLLARSARINLVNSFGETALYLACLAGNAWAVTKLVACGADASICAGPHGISCLHWLFNFDEREHEGIASQLYGSGASFCKAAWPVEDRKYPAPITWEHFPFYWPRGTPLHWACFARSITACDALLRLGASVNEVGGTDGPHAPTPLAMAAFRGDSAVVQYLLSSGADPNRLDETGSSPAHLLAGDSHIAGPLTRFWPLKWWTYHGSWETHRAELTRCLTLLSSAGGTIDGPTRRVSEGVLQAPILDAAVKGDGGALLALLSCGSSTAATEAVSGGSLLHTWLCRDGRRGAYESAFEAVLEALSNQEGAVLARDRRGWTVLHYCVHAQNEEDFRNLSTYFLSKARILLETADNHGQTPLLQTAQFKASDDEEHLAVTRSTWLCDNGADMTVLDNEGCGLLLHACSNDQLSDGQCLQLIQRMLLAMSHAERLAHVRNSVSHETGKTPLMCACDCSFLEVIKYLVPLTDDINKICHGSLTALDYALNQALWMRQSMLQRWLFNGIIRWHKDGSYFQPLFGRFGRDSLHSRDLVWKDGKAMEALFQQPWAEGDAKSVVRRKVDVAHAAKYFACMDVIRLLIKAGAVRAKFMCSDPGIFNEYGPRERDNLFIEIFDDELAPGFPQGQPFLRNHWDLLYEILQD